MQKWEQRQKQKAHDAVVGKAKSSVKSFSRSRQKHLNSSHSRIKVAPLQKNFNFPFLKILEIFQLQCYASLLIDNGFPHRLMEREPLECIDAILNKVQEQDQEKVLSLMNTLVLMYKDLRKFSYRTPVVKKQVPSHYPPTYSLKQSSSASSKKTEKNVKFRIKSRHTSHHLVESPKKTAKKVVPKPKQYNSKKRIRAADDSMLIHDYTRSNGKMTTLMNSNSVVRRLADKLEIEREEENNISHESLNLEFDKVKQMYLSYDSGTLSSNITNIDSQAIIECLAIEIYKMLTNPNDSVYQPKTTIKNNKKNIRNLLKESIVLMRQQILPPEPQHQDNISEELQSQIKSSIAQLDNSEFPPNKYLRDEEEAVSQGSFDMEESDDFLKMSSPESFIADFSCFNNRFPGSMYCNFPENEDIKNFIQLILMAGKMQKEIPIIAYAYLRKLLSAANRKVNRYNWRNLTLITLVEASKIWDDQSLENPSFAKVLHPYTTLEINRLEKYLLHYLGYSLTLNQQDYCQSYFLLRRNSPNATKTANLIQLDLKTIKKLQSGPEIKKKENKLKDFYKKCMNKSF